MAKNFDNSWKFELDLNIKSTIEENVTNNVFFDVLLYCPKKNAILVPNTINKQATFRINSSSMYSQKITVNNITNAIFYNSKQFTSSKMLDGKQCGIFVKTYDEYSNEKRNNDIVFVSYKLYNYVEIKKVDKTTIYSNYLFIFTIPTKNKILFNKAKYISFDNGYADIIDHLSDVIIFANKKYYTKKNLMNALIDAFCEGDVGVIQYINAIFANVENKRNAAMFSFNRNSYLTYLLSQINAIPRIKKLFPQDFIALTTENLQQITQYIDKVLKGKEKEDMFNSYVSFINYYYSTYSHIKIEEDIITKYQYIIDTFIHNNHEYNIFIQQRAIPSTVHKLIEKLENSLYGLSYPEYINLVLMREDLEADTPDERKKQLNNIRRYIKYTNATNPFWIAKKGEFNMSVPYEEFIKNPDDYLSQAELIIQEKRAEKVVKKALKPPNREKPNVHVKSVAHDEEDEEDDEDEDFARDRGVAPVDDDA